MNPFLFWFFAFLMLVFGAAVIINRNPIASALSLVICFMGLSALFMSLDAFFIGIIQVLVYAGAVMVLFLFIIMLLDLRAENLRKINYGPRLYRGAAEPPRGGYIQLGLERALDFLEQGHPASVPAPGTDPRASWDCWRTRCGRHSSHENQEGRWSRLRPHGKWHCADRRRRGFHHHRARRLGAGSGKRAG